MKPRKPGPKRGTKHAQVKRSAFGQRMFATRKARGMTQQQLADKLGISKRMVAHYESNTEGPSIERVTEIAEALNVTASYLLGESTLKAIRDDMPPQLRSHVRTIRELSPRDRKKVLEYAELLAKANGYEKP